MYHRTSAAVETNVSVTLNPLNVNLTFTATVYAPDPNKPTIINIHNTVSTMLKKQNCKIPPISVGDEHLTHMLQGSI